MAGFTIKNVSTGNVPLTAAGKNLVPGETVTGIYRISAADFARYSESKLTISPTPTLLDAETGDYTAPDRLSGGDVLSKITTTNPTVNDDVSLGFIAGSEWFNKTDGVLWYCTDNTDGAAVWVAAALGSVKKNNMTATTNPAAATDDITLGYTPGSLWLNKTLGILWVCTDNTDGAAVWVCAALGAVTKNNMNATTNPGTGNDTTQGYSVGSMWLNKSAHRIYFCEDDSTGAAVWKYATIA